MGVRAIQEAVAAKGFYDCSKAMVVTNSFFTSEAKILAEKNNVELWNRKVLANAMLKIKEKAPDISNDDKHNLTNNCVLCGVTVSDKVREYCMDHSEEFEGNVYCYDHQKNIRRQMK